MVSALLTYVPLLRYTRLNLNDRVANILFTFSKFCGMAHAIVQIVKWHTNLQWFPHQQTKTSLKQEQSEARKTVAVYLLIWKDNL